MAQIFNSHSRRDVRLRDFFSRAFAGTKVAGVFEELERIVAGSMTTARVEQDIAASSAMFVVLGQGVQNISTTRDWVTWEVGAAAAKGKDVWVFENTADSGKISVVTPKLTHYVVYDTGVTGFRFVRNVIRSYDDSEAIGRAVIGAGIGALLSMADRGAGAVVGSLAGLVTSGNVNLRPTGKPTTCPTCSSTYKVHLLSPRKEFRCPVCNASLRLVNPIDLKCYG